MILIDVYNVPPVQLYALIIMYDSIEWFNISSKQSAGANSTFSRLFMNSLVSLTHNGIVFTIGWRW